MKSKLRRVLSVFAVLAMLCTLLPLSAISVAAANVDVLVNGNFETGNGNGWRLESGTSVTTADVHGGSYAIKTTNTATKYQLIARQTYDVQANTDYVFTFWYKYVGSNSAPSFYAIVKDGSESVSLNDSNSRVSPSGSAWTKVSYTVNSGDYTSLALVLQNRTAGDGGTYYFDDFSFVGPEPVELPDEPVNPVPEVKNNLVENGNFETGNANGWEKHQSTAISADAAYTGYYGANLKGNGGWGGMLNQTVAVTAGQSYQVSMWVKAVSNGVNIQIMDGGSSGTKLGSDWFTKTEWTYKTWSVTPTTNSLFLNFCGGGNGVAENVYVDDIVVIKAPLITNGDFETGDKSGWSCNSGTSTIVTDAYNGNYALQISNPSAWGEACIRTVGVKKNTQYEISFKAKRVSGTGAFNLVVSQTVSPWTKFTKISGQNWMAANDKTDANGWASYTCVYDSGDNAQMLIKFTAEAANPGTLILDDITVTELKEPSFDGYLKNGDLETGKSAPWNVSQSTEVSEDAACNGEYGLYLSGNGGWGGMAYQDITTVPGENYYFYGYFKANSAGVNIQILDQVSGDKLISTYFSKTGWSVVQLKFIAKSTTTRINICGSGTGTAEKVYADDMFIVSVTPQGSSFDGYIYNGDFEAGTTVNWNTHQQTILSTKAAYEGAAGVIMKGTGWGGTINQSFNVDMGNTYKVSFWYKPISNGINMQILDAATSEKLTSTYLSTTNGSDWMLFEKTFNVGYTTKVTLNFCGSGSSSADEMYIDNISIVNLDGEENIRTEATKNSGVSVRDAADDVRGLAFRFHLNASGVQVIGGNQYVAGTGKVNLYKNRVVEGKLLYAGAIVTNNATIGASYADFTLDNVNGKNTIDVPAQYLLDLDDGSMGYAVRIINIPDANTSTEIYARPYYVYEVDGEEVVVYGALSHANYDGVSGEHKSISVLGIGNDSSDVYDYLAPILESADYDNVVLGPLYNNGELDFDANYTYERYQYGNWEKTKNVSAAEILSGDWDYVVIQSAEGVTVVDLQAFIDKVDAATDADLYWNSTTMDAVSLSRIQAIIPAYTAQENLLGTGVEVNADDADYLTAMAQFAVITGETLDQITYYPVEVSDNFYDMARSVAHAMYNPYEIADLSEVILLAGSDFQPSGGNVALGRENVSKILGALADAGYGLFDGFLSGGDYSTGTSEPETTAGLAGLDAEISKVVYNNKFYSQGNHDPDSTIGLSQHGNNDPFGAPYGLFLINEDNYADTGAGGAYVAKELTAYFNEKINGNWGNKPIFILCHVPLNFSMRSVTGQNARTAMPIVEACNAAGEQGLNIIFLFGHNHSGGYDNYIGGGSVYLKKGDTMLVPSVADYTVPTAVTLNFTYMTAGYIGYYGTTDGGADGALTMSVFRIQKDGSVIIGRYDENGIHNLKSEGVKNTSRNDIMDPDPTVYESYRVVTGTSDEKYEG